MQKILYCFSLFLSLKFKGKWAGSTIRDCINFIFTLYSRRYTKANFILNKCRCKVISVALCFNLEWWWFLYTLSVHCGRHIFAPNESTTTGNYLKQRCYSFLASVSLCDHQHWDRHYGNQRRYHIRKKIVDVFCHTPYILFKLRPSLYYQTWPTEHE